MISLLLITKAKDFGKSTKLETSAGEFSLSKIMHPMSSSSEESQSPSSQEIHTRSKLDGTNTQSWIFQGHSSITAVLLILA